jgi:hypothetical protein
VRDTVRNDTCLAAARPGENEHRAFDGTSGFELLGIQKLG